MHKYSKVGGYSINRKLILSRDKIFFINVQFGTFHNYCLTVLAKYFVHNILHKIFCPRFSNDIQNYKNTKKSFEIHLNKQTYITI